MLVLTRKIGESIQIGPGVTVTLLEVDRNKVRLGIEAPRSVPVARTELLQDGDIESFKKGES